MTSALSEEDVRFIVYSAGIKEPAKLNSLMRVINLYAYTLARKMNGAVLEEAPVPLVQLHLCRSCGDMKTAEEFPESKRTNINKGVSCTACQDKRRYKCIGPCQQHRRLGEFPEHKQANPHIPSVCTRCSPKKITQHETVQISGIRSKEIVPEYEESS